jgi:hypothetical protein
MSAMYDEPGLKRKPYQLHAVMVHEGEANQAGLEKNQVFFLKNPAQWVISGFLGFLGFFTRKREFLGFFSFKNIFRCIKTLITINILLFLKVRDFRILCGKIS